MKVFKSRRVILGLVVLAIIVVLAAAMAHKVMSPLPAPIPPRGQILDAITGKAVVGAQIETDWQLSDYPMLDGAGSYKLSSVTITDDEGRFSLVIPNHRRGIWNTALCTPIIRATGYEPFTFDDANAVTYVNGESVIIRLTPVSL